MPGILDIAPESPNVEDRRGDSWIQRLMGYLGTYPQNVMQNGTMGQDVRDYLAPKSSDALLQAIAQISGNFRDKRDFGPSYQPPNVYMPPIPPAATQWRLPFNQYVPTTLGGFPYEYVPASLGGWKQ